LYYFVLIIDISVLLLKKYMLHCHCQYYGAEQHSKMSFKK